MMKNENILEHPLFYLIQLYIYIYNIMYIYIYKYTVCICIYIYVYNDATWFLYVETLQYRQGHTF